MEGWSCQNQSEAPHHDDSDRVPPRTFSYLAGRDSRGTCLGGWVVISTLFF